jgi:hypothetical protein
MNTVSTSKVFQSAFSATKIATTSLSMEAGRQCFSPSHETELASGFFSLYRHHNKKSVSLRYPRELYPSSSYPVALYHIVVATITVW